MEQIAIEGLPDDPLLAAGSFHNEWLAQIEHSLGQGSDVMICIPAADHTHHEWRKAAVAMLARKHTPQRVNMVGGSGAHAQAAIVYLASAHGVTGQYLEAAA